MNPVLIFEGKQYNFLASKKFYFTYLSQQLRICDKNNGWGTELNLLTTASFLNGWLKHTLNLISI